MRNLPRQATSIVILAALINCGCEDKRDSAATSEAQKPPVAVPAVQAVASVPAPAAPKPEEKAKEERSAGECPEGNIIDFPNADFEAAVRKKLEKPEGDISKADLAKLRSLNVSQIKQAALDVCVFPYMTGLKELF